MKRAVELYLAGNSLRAVEAETGVNRETLRAHLANEGIQRRPRIYGSQFTAKERLMQFVTIAHATGCWEFHHRTHESGYGVISINRKKDLAHRHAWRAFKGPIPSGLYVLHSCDNPPCINPEHLFLGTQTDNMRDCANKGRLGGVTAP